MPPSEDALKRYLDLEIDDTGTFLELYGSLMTKPIETRITRTGNSTGVTIPKAVVEYLGFDVGDPVKVIIIPDKERDKRK